MTSFCDVCKVAASFNSNPFSTSPHQQILHPPLSPAVGGCAAELDWTSKNPLFDELTEALAVGDVTASLWSVQLAADQQTDVLTGV